MIWERSEVLGGLHGGCNEWVRSLCGGFEMARVGDAIMENGGLIMEDG